MENALGFSTTGYKSFPAWLNDIRQDTDKPSKDKKALSSISDEDLKSCDETLSSVEKAKIIRRHKGSFSGFWTATRM